MHRWPTACPVMLLALLGSATAGAADIQVTTSDGDVILSCPATFRLRFDKSSGGNITQYYDLASDPGATTNLAAAEGSIYSGLFFIMFKQESPELWTANFRVSAQTLEVVDAQPDMVKVRARGVFPGGGFSLPASFRPYFSLLRAHHVGLPAGSTAEESSAPAQRGSVQVRRAILGEVHIEPAGLEEERVALIGAGLGAQRFEAMTDLATVSVVTGVKRGIRTPSSTPGRPS